MSREQLTAALAALGVDAALERPLQPARHVFTHKIWQLSGWAGSAPAVPLPEGWVWGRPEDYPLPSAFEGILSQKAEEKTL